MDLTVVIPCLNEEKTIAECIDKCIKSFAELGISGEILVVDNGSDDNSAEIAKSKNARVETCIEKGYGNVLRCGFSHSNSKYILFADGDNTYDLLEIPLLWNKLTPDTDMVIGSRQKGKIEKGAMPFLNRYLGTPVLTSILNILYGTKISDSQCGMRLIKKECLDKIEFKTTGMEFASEIIVEFVKHKFKIIETPISLYKGAEGRIPHLRPWRDGWRHLTYLIKSKF